MRDSLEPSRYRTPRSRRSHVVLLVAVAAVLGTQIILRPPVAGAVWRGVMVQVAR